jgi:hypothetical protein
LDSPLYLATGLDAESYLEIVTSGKYSRMLTTPEGSTLKYPKFGGYSHPHGEDTEFHGVVPNGEMTNRGGKLPRRHDRRTGNIWRNVYHSIDYDGVSTDEMIVILRDK